MLRAFIDLGTLDGIILSSVVPQLIREYEAGVAFDDLVRRPPLPPGKTPMDMRAETRRV